MKKLFLLAFLLACPLIGFGNYFVNTARSINFVSGHTKDYLIFDIPQFYLQGNSNHGFVECYIQCESSYKEIKSKIQYTIHTENYSPAPHAAGDATYTLEQKAGDKFKLKYYMGEKADINKSSHISFMVKQLDNNEGDQLRLGCFSTE